MRLLREGMSAGIALGFLVWAGGFASAQTSELPQSAPGTLAQSSSGATSPASAQPTNSPQASGAVPADRDIGKENLHRSRRHQGLIAAAQRHQYQECAGR
jgi:hypothetical protein